MTNTVIAAWVRATEIGRAVMMPALKIGYGKLPLADFGGACVNAKTGFGNCDLSVCLVMRSAEDQALMLDMGC